MIWLLIILNTSGGEPAQIYFDDKDLCEAAASAVESSTGYARAVCVYAGEE